MGERLGVTRRLAKEIRIRAELERIARQPIELFVHRF
jgi:hypothetical protein